MTKRIKVRQCEMISLTKKDIDEIFATTACERDPEVESTPDTSSYRLPGDRLLRVFEHTRAKHRGVLYASRTDYLEMIREVEAYNGQPNHVLDDVFPYGEDFPTQVPRLIEALPGEFKLAPALLDKSLKSLPHIDKAVRRIGPGNCLTPERFPLLVAYFGEVLRLATSGRWFMRYDAPTQVWEPYIASPRGRHDTFLFLYKELLEATRRSACPSVQVTSQL